uniref:Chemokine (C-C motif) receptor 2 n=1 Tax=Neogobius melanostomus TaxID=47308 RepID=A0A8C6UWT0_9GOBI
LQPYTDYVYDYCNYTNCSLDITPCEFGSATLPLLGSNFATFLAIFLPCLYILVFIAGFVGNGLVVCVLLKQCYRSNLTDLCLLNLSVSDLLFLLTLPLYAYYTAVSYWVFGDFLCQISVGLHNMGSISSVLFMVLMTLDRYVLIQHAQQASKYRTMKTGMVLSVSVWVLSLCLSLPAFVFTQEVITAEVNTPERITCEPYGDNKLWFEYNTFVTNILGLVFPLSVMVACYSRIIPTLMKIRSAKKHRIVKVIISIMIIFFLFWAPYNITIFLDFLRLEGVLTDSCELYRNLRLSTAVTETIGLSHCCLNPIIYAFAGQRFMKRSQVMLRKILPRIPFSSSRDLLDSSFRMSSVTSRTTTNMPLRSEY